jgi:peroxiredoxin
MRTRPILAVVVTAVVALLLVVALTRPADEGSRPPSPSPAAAAGSPSPPPAVGAPAPEVSGQAVRGGEQRLSTLRGRVVVLGFVSTGIAGTGPGADRSKSQLVVLRSMSTQYQPRGATTLVIDAEGTGDDRHDELVNYTYDTNLPFPLLAGQSAAKAAAGYGVRQVPTVVVIDRSGRIAHRWDGYAPPAQLAAVLEQLCDPK